MSVTFTGDDLATPQLALGIPIPDSNTQTPDLTAGLPLPWSYGALVSGHITGHHLVHPSAWPVSGIYAANPYGVGRSILVSLQTDMDGPPASLGGTGLGNSYLRTPPSVWGFVPKLGYNETCRVSLLLAYNASLGTGAGDDEVTISLEQYNSADTMTSETAIAVLDVNDNPAGADWKSYTAEASINFLAATKYLKVCFWFEEAAGVGGLFALDFVGLAWLPNSTGVGTSFPAVEDDYVGRNLRFTWETQANKFRLPGAYGHHVSTPGRAMKRALVDMEYLRASQQTRDNMLFLWHAQNGAYGDEDEVLSTVGGELAGKAWPLIMRPNRPGAKQALYCRFREDPFFLDVDNRTGYVEDPPVFSGVSSFEEVIF